MEKGRLEGSKEDERERKTWREGTEKREGGREREEGRGGGGGEGGREEEEEREEEEREKEKGKALLPASFLSLQLSRGECAGIPQVQLKNVQLPSWADQLDRCIPNAPG